MLFRSQIFLGDIVDSKFDLHKPSFDIINNITTPSYIAAGNHDIEYSKFQSRDSLFNTVFGASTYSFNRGDVHFIVIQNVLTTKEKKEYRGEYTQKQLQFIKNDLAHVPDDKLIVISQHIPGFETVNFNDLIKLLSPRKEVLVLSAHTHMTKRKIEKIEDVMVHEINAGTSCGTFWRGEQSWNQIPLALMTCGTPRCYFTIDFDKTDYKINYKAIDSDPSLQMEVWINNPISNKPERKSRLPKKQVSQVKENDIYPSGAIVANLFGASDSTKVLIKIDDNDFVPMTKQLSVSPRVAYLRHLYSEKILPSDYCSALPLRKINSPHLWIFVPEEELTSGIHHLTIIAEDDFGYKVEWSQSFIK